MALFGNVWKVNGDDPEISQVVERDSAEEREKFDLTHYSLPVTVVLS